eukprot:4539830-Prorocentrum_lima.AAC.1
MITAGSVSRVDAMVIRKNPPINHPSALPRVQAAFPTTSTNAPPITTPITLSMFSKEMITQLR